ncbi:SET domain-containing protein-lysine N-methyltransferase [Lentzea sp. NPDC005914]|uniref:SET domain-containing protein-lysine N-methyltransferase n=1 Tax=Lentzea sp. NPDC005914 TaxID=3154572 RepID=UPI003402791D
MIVEEHVGVMSAVAVVRADGEYRLVANRPVAKGELLFTIDGELTATPTRYTVQIGHGTHVDVPGEYDFEAILDRFYWRFMNHSCDPTVFIRGRSVISLKPVKFGQDITFNYNTTEFDMAEPFGCRCGSVRCTGMVQGFLHLSDEERQRLRPWLAAHLSPTGAR